MSFYDEVLRELITALGAALFLANLFALVRRRSDARRAAQRQVAVSYTHLTLPTNREV